MGSYRTSLLIHAPAERVFDHFVNPELLVRWMGDYAVLEAQPGGQFSVDINGVLIRGSFVTLDRPHRLEIAWGEAGNALMPPGSTALCITLTPQGSSTLLELEHDGLLDAEAEKPAVGWPHFLGRLGRLACGDDPGRDPWADAPPA